MLTTKWSRRSAARAVALQMGRITGAVLLCVALVLVVAQIVGHAAPVASSLHYSTGFLVTGNYVVGSVDLTEGLNPPDVNGLSTGTISMSGVPADADIVAAYLYWEEITLTADPTQATAKFRGNQIPLDDVVAVKKASQNLADGTATCWSSGTPLTMTEFRADVLRFLPIRLDKNNKPTGKRLVNDADLTAHGKPLHTVTLPTRNGNQIPESAGATLVVVYKDQSQPLRKIVFYGGIHIQSSIDEATTLTLSGIYKSAAVKSAKITHILASGQPNSREQISFEDGATHTNTVISPPDPVIGSTASARGWSALTYDVSDLMHPTSALTGAGETVTTRLSHLPASGGYDCLTLGAVIFSTAVADTDLDGLPDGVEDATSGLTDADGQSLPNLSVMGASSSHRDLFIEINATRTLVPKTHGSPAYPYNSTASLTSVSVPPHTHLPTPEVLKLVGDAYLAHGITPHFDVGDVAAYHSLGAIPHGDWVDDYTSSDADSYLVSSDPRGGEVVDEITCDATVTTCQFPGFPGTVGWKFGLQLYRDWPVSDTGQELTDAQLDDWLVGVGSSTQHRQRFDPNRRGLFHYLLYAHYRGLPKSEFPCLDTSTDPDTPTITGYANGTCSGASIANNPDYHVPSSSSGVADLPGGNAMVTLGRWDEYVGRPFVRASTTFHELGHNLNLSHGGFAPVAGNKALNTATSIEPNCKTNYISSMSYSFQVFGLFLDDDSIHLDYSSTAESNIAETTPEGDAPLGPAPDPAYRPVWYAPAGSLLATTLGVPIATRYCNGLKFDPTSPPPSMARVYSTLSADPIDWNGDASTGNTANPSQDVNFDASLSSALRGFDDWANLRLDQISAGLKVATLQNAQGGINNFEGGFGNFEGGLNNFEGGLNNFEGGFGNFEGGINNFEGGLTNFEGGFTNFEGAQELEVEAAKGLGRSTPYALKACIVGNPDCLSAPPFDPLYHGRFVGWQGATFGHVSFYHVSRKRGTPSSSYSYGPPVPISTSPTTSFVDTEQLPDGQLPNGVLFSYRVRAEYDDPHEFSGFSKPVTIAAVNNAPVANPNAYTTAKGKALKVTTQLAGVLGNDTDVDSPASFIKAVLVSGPLNGTLLLSADGRFTYTPKNGFTGVDTFTYKANNGFWSADPTVKMGLDSNTVTVTITVTAK